MDNAFASYDRALDTAFDRVFDNYQLQRSGGGGGGGGGAGAGDETGNNFDPNFDQPYSLISHGDANYRNDSRFEFDVNDIIEMDDLENMKVSSISSFFFFINIFLRGIHVYSFMRNSVN